MTTSDEVDALDEFDRLELARRKRQRRIGVAVVGPIVLVMLGLIGWRRLTGLPSLDRETEQDVREALPEIEKLPLDVRRSFAAHALAELEPERLPAALLGAFVDYGSMPPEYAGMLLLRPFAEDPATRETWALACPAGLGAIAEGGAEGAAVTFERCELGRLGLLARDELGGVTLGEMVACHAAWAWLKDHHADSELERRLLRMLMLGR